VEEQMENPPNPKVKIIPLEHGRVMIRELDEVGNLIHETFGIIEEERVPIEGYEGYEITSSGRIFSIARNRYRVRNNNEYGFKYVHLSKNGKRERFETFELWKKVFRQKYPGSHYLGER
jgi:hypothetical protein